MSSLGGDDRDLHYSDGSHRWTGPSPDPRKQREWEAQVQAHVDEHLRTMGGPPARPASVTRLVVPPQRRTRPQNARPGRFDAEDEDQAS